VQQAVDHIAYGAAQNAGHVVLQPAGGKPSGLGFQLIRFASHGLVEIEKPRSLHQRRSIRNEMSH
jgi:hypothetical protein